MNPSQRLGIVTSELYSGIGSVLGTVENKIHSIAYSNRNLRGLLQKVEKNRPLFFQGMFGALCLYNFYKNPMTFATGALIGIYSSVNKKLQGEGKAPEGEEKEQSRPINKQEGNWEQGYDCQVEENKPFLNLTPIFGLTAEDNFLAPKILACVTILKACLGTSVLDVTFFRMFAGFIAGNSFYHARNANEQDYFAGKMQSIAKMMEPYVNKVFSKFTSHHESSNTVWK